MYRVLTLYVAILFGDTMILSFFPFKPACKILVFTARGLRVDKIIFKTNA